MGIVPVEYNDAQHAHTVPLASEQAIQEAGSRIGPPLFTRILHRPVRSRQVLMPSHPLQQDLSPNCVQDLEHARLKGERQSQLLVNAELARHAAEEERGRIESRFARSERGAALLRATRLKMELTEARERLAACEARLKEQAREGKSAVNLLPRHSCMLLRQQALAKTHTCI